MPPSFNGVAIFGPCPTFDHDDPPNAEQINHYPGVRGVERLDLGLAISTTMVRGLMCGVTPGDVGACFVALRQLKISGVRGLLIDTDGISWPDAVVHSLRTIGRTEYAPGWGWCKEYELKILHLGYNPN